MLPATTYSSLIFEKSNLRISSLTTPRFFPGKDFGKFLAKFSSYSTATTLSNFFKSELVKVPSPGPISTHVLISGIADKSAIPSSIKRSFSQCWPSDLLFFNIVLLYYINTSDFAANNPKPDSSHHNGC